MSERNLLMQLREMGRQEPPATLAATVLDAVGLSDRWGVVGTAIGPLAVAHGRHGISAVMRTDDARTFAEYHADVVGRPLRPGDVPAPLERAVRDRVEGRGRHRIAFDLRRLTEFERDVLDCTESIPRGEVRPYGWVAREIGRPAAVRAVGTALAHNPVPYLIPCHRVVRTDGHIGEYGGGGPTAKRALLLFEGVAEDELAALVRGGARFVGSDTTDVFCLPTCRHARRITPHHRQSFRTAGEALMMGYRPCRDCRPAA